MKVLITGGASGLGYAITEKLCREGATVHFTFHRSVEAADLLQSAYPGCRAYRCDFTQADQVQALAREIDNIQPDILINNAYSGTFIGQHFHKTDAEDFRNAFETNVMPVIVLTQAVIAFFRTKKQGRIVTILSSALHHQPPIGTSAYVATKAYIASLVKSWAAENARFNISSNALSPTFVPTAFTSALDERLVEQMRENSPLKRFLSPAEVADAVYALSCAPAGINGQDIEFDAGQNITEILGTHL